MSACTKTKRLHVMKEQEKNKEKIAQLQLQESKEHSEIEKRIQTIDTSNLPNFRAGSSNLQNFFKLLNQFFEDFKIPAGYWYRFFKSTFTNNQYDIFLIQAQNISPEPSEDLIINHGYKITDIITLKELQKVPWTNAQPYLKDFDLKEIQKDRTLNEYNLTESYARIFPEDISNSYYNILISISIVS
eukprot:gene2921-4760_t